MLITHLRAKVELGRQPHLAGEPVLIVDRSQTRPLVVDRTFRPPREWPPG